MNLPSTLGAFHVELCMHHLMGTDTNTQQEVDDFSTSLIILWHEPFEMAYTFANQLNR